LATIYGGDFDSDTLTSFFNLTLPKIDSDVRDAIFKQNTYLKYMDTLGAIDRNQTGDGCYIQWEMDENDSVAARALSSSIDLNYQDINRTGVENYGEYSGAISIDHVTVNKNSGKERLINYIESQKMNLIKTLKKRFNNDLMNGSGAFPTLTGLTTLISITPTSGTIHGVSRSGKAWIQNQQAGASCSTTDGFGVVCLKDIYALLKNASTGMGDQSMFKLAVMDKTVHTNMAYYLPDIANSQRIVINSNPGKNIPAEQLKYAGENTFYLGEALAIWDNLAPSDSIRWINPDTLRIKILKNCDMVTAMREAQNSFSKAILTGSSMMQVNLNPRYSAVLNAFSS